MIVLKLTKQILCLDKFLPTFKCSYYLLGHSASNAHNKCEEVSGHEFVSFYHFAIRFWNCSDIVVFFVLHFNVILRICELFDLKDKIAILTPVRDQVSTISIC